MWSFNELNNNIIKILLRTRRLCTKVSRPQTSIDSKFGFTLIELMIVISIIALLATFGTIKVLNSFSEAKVKQTKVQIKQLSLILTDFKRVCGFFPSSEQGLDSLVKPPAGRECKNYPPGGFMQDNRVPTDGFGNTYEYILNGSKFTIRSFGEDGKEGGDGWDKDISSDDTE